MKKVEKAKKMGVENLENYELFMILTETDEENSKICLKNGWLGIETSILTNNQKIKYDSFFEAVRRVSIEELPQRYEVSSTTTAGSYATKLLLNKPVEEFHLILLNNRNKVICTEILNKGTINECIVYKREVIKKILDVNASKIVMCHNHPSGNLKPSKADIKLTNKLLESFKTIDIQCLDHIIVAGNDYFSFAENSLLE